MADRLGGAVDQLPFALANALTAAAFTTRAFLVDDVWPRHVEQRNKRFISASLRIDKATKRNLSVSIFDNLGRGHLALHAKGGTKQAKKRLAIPATGAVRRSGKGVRKSETPYAIRAMTPARALRVLPHGIFVGKGGRLHLVYSFKQSAHQPEDVPFFESFQRVMRAELKAGFSASLKNAMATRGKKSRYDREAALGRRRLGSSHGNAGSRR
ncbi:hypothetical protein OSH11_17210 [Kaistia dalseonensis]|uniref:Uncharacterized protein n=1 Tax=Kaistia dalseonensis TaxID=410840 RepID=A0ABU0H9S4_9HYPH|nr:hypothetical protein [Kaistia dalseonensis]MCX5496449.1 hypothetical protein [Kaistia dalseonensis]MDQ0439070.1 hypothetical protein [Kaistia dalseonensis]